MEKVSKIEGGIESKYISMKYLPSVDKSNPDLNGKCNILISFMAIADATREDEDIESLVRAFCEALLACKTQEEVNNFAVFMNELANIGGLATSFNNQVKSMINQNDRNAAQKIIQSIDSKKQVAKENENKTNSNELVDFQRNYARLNNELEKFKEKSMVNDRDFTLLREMYQNLRSQLYRIKGRIDASLFEQYDRQINNDINYLNSISESLSELDRPISR